MAIPRADGHPRQTRGGRHGVTGFSIADPNDAGMLDVVGFDAAAPNAIADFIAAL